MAVPRRDAGTRLIPMPPGMTPMPPSGGTPAAPSPPQASPGQAVPPPLCSGDVNPAAPAVRSLGNDHGAGDIVRLVNRTVSMGRGYCITFWSVLNIVLRHCAPLTYCPHPKLRKKNAVPITPQPITLPLRRAGSVAGAHMLCSVTGTPAPPAQTCLYCGVITALGVPCHGDTLYWQKGPHIWAWGHFALAKRHRRCRSLRRGWKADARPAVPVPVATFPLGIKKSWAIPWPSHNAVLLYSCVPSATRVHPLPRRTPARVHRAGSTARSGSWQRECRCGQRCRPRWFGLLRPLSSGCEGRGDVVPAAPTVPVAHLHRSPATGPRTISSRRHSGHAAGRCSCSSPRCCYCPPRPARAGYG